MQAFLFDAAERRRRSEESVVKVLQAASLREVILPVLDYAAPYEGVTADGDDHLYRFMDREGEMLSLRADFTPMAARVVAPRLARETQPVALFYRGDVVRDEASGVGRPKEFAQVGAERYGDPSFAADEDMLELLLRCLEGVPSSRLRLTLGYADLLPRLLSAVAPSLLLGDGSRLVRLMGRVRERRVSEVESTLRHEGASPEVAEEVSQALLQGFDPASPLFLPPILQGAARELRRAAERAERVRPGVSVVVDLAGTPTAPYYTGLTFRAVAKGVAMPLAAGGRYDDLLARFGAKAPALGFSIGVEALGLAMEADVDDGVDRPLRLALGKGRLLGKTLDLLRAAGVDFPEPDGRKLLVPDRDGRHELILLKDDDVPTYVAQGGADLGIVGSDRIAESGLELFSPVELPFGVCRLSLIGRAGEEFRPNGHPVRVGTKYRRLAARYFDERRIAHEIVTLAGSVELAAALGLTDVVVDLIETGGTMAANGLVEIETILRSRATLVVGPSALASRRSEIAALVAGLSTPFEVPA